MDRKRNRARSSPPAQRQANPIQPVFQPAPTADKASQLLTALSPAHTILLLPHDNPDPDALASSVALSELIRRNLEAQTLIGLGGFIGRAENRALVSRLAIPLVPVERVLPHFAGAVVLVDTQPGRGNNSLPAGVTARAVIDHHPDWGTIGAVPFVDLRANYGATSTIVTEYLEAAEVPLEPRIATALFYGIASETQHLGRETYATDILASQYLYPYVDKRLLSAIENPALRPEYFALMSVAIRNTVLYGDVAVTVLDSVLYPDAVAEIADFLLRMETLSWTVCLAPYQGFLYISLRSAALDAEAGRLLARLLPPGMAGGHGLSAGGRLKTSHRGWKLQAYRIVQDLLNSVAQNGVRPRLLVSGQGQTDGNAQIRQHLLAMTPHPTPVNKDS